MRFNLSRRTLLRGVQATVALPVLEAMVDSRGRWYGAAHAEPVAPPRRLFILHWPQGVPAGWSANGGEWFPRQAGAGYTMGECLQPLARHQADFNILTGLSYAPIANHWDAHGHSIAVFTGWAARVVNGQGQSQGPSVEYLAGQRLGRQTRFSSLAAGLYDQGDGWWSWSQAGVRNPLEVNPRSLFDALFGQATMPGGQAEVEARRAQSILDRVKGDLQRLQGKLGAPDRQRLDEHLTSVRELEKAVTAVPEPATCARPSAPTSGVRYTHAQLPEYARLMIDLMVMAHRCDLTRVSFLSLGGIWLTFPQLGISTDYHNVVHSGFNDSASAGRRIEEQVSTASGKNCGDYTNQGAAYTEAERRECAEKVGALRGSLYRRISTHFMEQVAHSLDRLKATDGTSPPLLDSTAYVALSEFGDGGLHDDWYIPVIVAGKAGRGAQGMRTGQNLAFRCQRAQAWQAADVCRSVSSGPVNPGLNDVWQSALTAVGALGPGELFGDPAQQAKPLPGLWV